MAKTTLISPGSALAAERLLCLLAALRTGTWRSAAELAELVDARFGPVADGATAAFTAGRYSASSSKAHDPGAVVQDKVRKDIAAWREAGVHIEQRHGTSGDEYRAVPTPHKVNLADFDDDERVAIKVALAATSYAGADRSMPSRVASAKLEPIEAVPIRAAIASSLPSSGATHLGIIWQAIRSHRRLAFDYLGAPRVVSPGAVRAARGWLYLVAHENGTWKTWRLDRLDQPADGNGQAGARGPRIVDSQIDPGLGHAPLPELEPWAFGRGDIVTCRLRIDEPAATRVRTRLGASLREDSPGTFDADVVDTERFGRWVVGLGSLGEVVAPPAVRQHVVDHLDAMLNLPPAQHVAAALQPSASEVGPGGRPSLTRWPVQLMAILAWGFAQKERPLRREEIVNRFDLAPDKIKTLLEDVAPLIGSPPFSPGDLVEVRTDDEGTVFTFGHGFFLEEPLALTADEEATVILALSSMCDVPGTDANGPVPKALARLLAARDLAASPLGAETPWIDPDLAETLSEAINAVSPVTITFHSVNGPHAAVVATPTSLDAIDGRWYLTHQADPADRIPVDHILSATTSASGTTQPQSAGASSGRCSPATWTRVVIEIPDDDPDHWITWAVTPPWFTEQPSPTDRGTIRVPLPVSDRTWLESVLLRLGDRGVLTEVDPTLAPEDIATSCARSVLARYEITAGEEA